MSDLSGTTLDLRLAFTGLAFGFGVYAASLAVCFSLPGPSTPLQAFQIAAITPVIFAIIAAASTPVLILRERQYRARYTTTWSRIKYLYPATYRSFAKFARPRWVLISGGILLASGLYNLIFISRWQ